MKILSTICVNPISFRHIQPLHNFDLLLNCVNLAFILRHKSCWKLVEFIHPRHCVSYDCVFCSYLWVSYLTCYKFHFIFHTQHMSSCLKFIVWNIYLRTHHIFLIMQQRRNNIGEIIHAPLRIFLLSYYGSRIERNLLPDTHGWFREF